MEPAARKNAVMTRGVRPGNGSAARSRQNRRAAAQRETSPFKPLSLTTDFPVVALGASAGGLDAFRKLFDELPADSGMAFILVTHLDPTHASMMVELLASHTKMNVLQAAD